MLALQGAALRVLLGLGLLVVLVTAALVAQLAARHYPSD